MKTFLRILIFAAALVTVACFDDLGGGSTGDAFCAPNVCCEVSCGGNGAGPWCPACLPACDLAHGSLGARDDCKAN